MVSYCNEYSKKYGRMNWMGGATVSFTYLENLLHCLWKRQQSYVIIFLETKKNEVMIYRNLWVFSYMAVPVIFLLPS